MLWMVGVPLGLSVLNVWLLTPTDSLDEVGGLRQFVAAQCECLAN